MSPPASLSTRFELKISFFFSRAERRSSSSKTNCGACRCGVALGTVKAHDAKRDS